MTRPLRLLAFAGSTRTHSLNKQLAQAAAALAQQHGAAVSWIDLRDHVLPLYDGDLEASQGQPAAALALREHFKTHDAVLLASPEYNGFFSPLLKNTLDWLSRPVAGEERHAAFKDKPVLLLSTNPGESGGARGLVPLRQLLLNLKALPHPGHYTLPHGPTAFDTQGRLSRAQDAQLLSAVVQEFLDRIKTSQAAAQAHNANLQPIQQQPIYSNV